MSEQPEHPLIFIITGEPSGDALGGRLMAALKERTGGAVRFAGVGGESMAAQGLDSLVDQQELAVMGLIEVLPKARRILKRIKFLVSEIERLRPAVLVTIDSWGLTMRVNKAVRAFADPIPQVHYVAPMTWVWKDKRNAQLGQWVDRLLTLLPNEPDAFAVHGLDARCVGHSLIESGAGQGDGEAFRKTHDIPLDAPVLAMLPGSRSTETSRLLPIFKGVVADLAQRHPGLHLVTPTVATVAKRVKAATEDWPAPVVVVHGEKARYDAFAASQAALAASGTVTLELAMAGVPMVIAYKVAPLTAFAFRRLRKTLFANLLNYFEDRYVIPEFLQEDCTVEKLSPALDILMQDGPERASQIAEAQAALERHFGLGETRPSFAAADAVLEMIGFKREGTTTP